MTAVVSASSSVPNSWLILTRSASAQFSIVFESLLPYPHLCQSTTPNRPTPISLRGDGEEPDSAVEFIFGKHTTSHRWNKDDRRLQSGVRSARAGRAVASEPTSA